MRTAGLWRCLGVGVAATILVPGALAQQTQSSGDVWSATDPIVRAMNRGVALMDQYDYAEAVKEFERVVAQQPNLVEARINLGIALFNRAGKGDMERAEQLMDAAIAAEPTNARALYFRAVMHQYRGEDAQAAPLLERVVAIEPNDGYAWYLLARSKAHINQPADAALEQAVKVNPGLVSAYYQLMTAAMREGRKDDAAKYQKTFTALRESPLAETFVMPQYRQMGPLATVRPMPPSSRRSPAGAEIVVGAPVTLLDGIDPKERPGAGGRVLARYGIGVAAADINNDRHIDLITTAAVRDGRRGVTLLLGAADGTFRDVTEASGLAGVHDAISCTFGDYDNDEKLDLFVACAGPNALFRGRGDGTFEDVTAKAGVAGGNVISASAVFLDADHDGDLDVFVCNVGTADDAGPAASQLLNNNADGTFVDIAEKAGVACADRRTVMIAPADLDSDRDLDLVVFHEGAPADVFFNERMGRYRAGTITAEPIVAPAGGVAQDFNGDGRPDILVSPSADAPSRLYLSDATGVLKPSTQFDGAIKALTSWGDPAATRVVDVDLDGDLDVVILGRDGHVLLNDGWGQFVLRANVWAPPAEGNVIGADATVIDDKTGVADVLRLVSTSRARLERLPTRLTPAPNWLGVIPTGVREADKRTRSNASGFGTRFDLRCGLHSQVFLYTGLAGGLNQSQAPVIFGLNGANKADFLAMTWSEGVTQAELELASGVYHRISETERKTSSCPVLFTWNGERFEFVADFAGVGGLGYLVSPGEYAPPQVIEHVKIEANQLRPRDGQYEMRIGEPMEEVAYVDRLELRTVDHPRDRLVYPDERLVGAGPPATHRLLSPERPLFPLHAFGPDGKDCTARLREVDRVYAYQPDVDRRFLGYCKPHALELDFGDGLPADAGRDVYLFVNGWIEYPYSQTTFGASQAGVHWESLRVEQRQPDGSWKVIVPDAGAPAGTGRMFTVPLTGALAPGPCRLRLSTNLEIYIDQVFLGADRGTADLPQHTVPLARAELRRVGFPREFSPDGQLPRLYAYDVIDPTSAFKMLSGAYTRYGPVKSLLESFDDQYVIFGSGDEIEVSFDAKAVPPPPDGFVRSFILISHAYCKDMDLYTAEPDTIAPLPFRAMSRYPYPPTEHYPDDETTRRYQREFNTRLIP